MRRADFHYDLPEELIAQEPLADRGASRLLCLDGASGEMVDRRFADLPELLAPGDLLVLNDTRVMPARVFGTKATGGRVEVLVERLTGPRDCLAHARASKTPKPGSELHLDGGARARVTGREGDLSTLELDRDWRPYLDAHGHMPLPPYIQRPDGAADRDRYQTVYANEMGAVAAPTAGLHFDEAMLDRLAALGVEQARVTLHVGAGTFQPVRADDISDHVMHEELLRVDAAACDAVHAARARGGRVVAVGTTVVRSLETAASRGASGLPEPFEGATDLFITPGYRFRAVDLMLTNFHLPESTLLMLVSAFAGRDAVLAAYRHAAAARYRFFSYGDAMLLAPSAEARA